MNRRTGPALRVLLACGLALAAPAICGAEGAPDPPRPLETLDDAGRRIHVVDVDGVETWFVYDGDGVLIQERRSDGTVVDYPRSQD